MTPEGPPARTGFRWHRLLIGYLLLLAASFGWRALRPDPGAKPDQQHIVTTAFEQDRPVTGKVRVAFRIRPGAGDVPPVLLLHGSPVASSSMRGMGTALAARYPGTIITPDLPGFGGSTRSLPDYSVRAHGAYVAALLDSLGIQKAHLIAYSMSGGVALEMYRIRPDQVASVTMLSAIGVQELELTGDYFLNHAIHGLQLSALWLVREAVPHFGYLDDAILGVPYARNFYDTDQRPLREILEGYAEPMLILHAEDDALVPYAAALEHRRIVPQSHLVTWPEGAGGHGLPFSRPDTLAARLVPFLSDVNEGSAATRQQATTARVAAAQAPFDSAALPPPSGFATAILMMLVGLATLASEDLASIGAGLMAARGTITFVQAVLAALIGIIVGDVGLYLLGRWVGRPLVNRAPFRWFIKEEQLERGVEWFDRRGMRAIMISRFVPGTRAPTYITAGVIHAPFLQFLGYFLVAGLLWTPLIVGSAYLVGNQVLEYYEVFEQYALWVLIGLVVLLFVGIRVVPSLATHNGRRRLYGRWRRLRDWEFWPPWVFYLPVVAYWLWLSVRHRSLTAFTAANPGIEDGGFIGESKSEILSELPADAVARWTLLAAGTDRKAALLDFMTAQSLEWPVVLKPDVGERGRGVTIARSSQDAAEHLQHDPSDTIAQAYVPGVEYGIFYARRPGATSGEIISITDKRLITVTGDGKRTLERLVLDDDRAVCMARQHLNAHASRVHEVPADGEIIPLVDLGTHCRGALFLDGADLASAPLLQEIDRMAQGFDGFYFGRFDIRGPSADAVSRGEGMRVIELNGVSSEATHIYAPGTSLRSAYAALFAQWRLAYRIGMDNIERGHQPAGIARLVRRLGDRIRAGLE